MFRYRVLVPGVEAYLVTGAAIRAKRKLGRLLLGHLDEVNVADSRKRRSGPFRDKMEC